MNFDMTHIFIDSVLRAFSFKRRLLAWDTYECHLQLSVVQSLCSINIDVAVIPGRCTKLLMRPGTNFSKLIVHPNIMNDWYLKGYIRRPSMEI